LAEKGFDHRFDAVRAALAFAAIVLAGDDFLDDFRGFGSGDDAARGASAGQFRQRFFDR
jgi:hypothetical protein